MSSLNTPSRSTHEKLFLDEEKMLPGPVANARFGYSLNLDETRWFRSLEEEQNFPFANFLSQSVEGEFLQVAYAPISGLDAPQEALEYAFLGVQNIAPRRHSGFEQRRYHPR